MILIDYRTGSKELAPYVHTKHEITTLEYGDASFVGMGDNEPTFVCIERKAIGDLVQSMASGRLSGHQLIGMLEQYTHIYLLVEGIWRPNPKSGVLEKLRGKKWVPVHHGSRKYMARDIYNYINTLAVMCNVIPVFTASIQQSGYWMDCTHAWWMKEWKDHKSHLKFHRQDVMPKKRRAVLLRRPTSFERIISGVSGVGFDTATLLQKHFHTPMELALATEEQLLSVKGIGKKIAKMIIKELRNGNI